ncbi:MAG TPA: cytochrome c biogenesis protein ResB [Syntrophales bacterium]|nr:cytochrome c biogenesis protein ResB [Syntrophales bacterium]HPQ44897.1 cytochrome c biogenesis protein ResB [Syntrophales bacterium]
MKKKLLIIYRCFGSVQFTIFLFITLALASILGTIVPQDLSPDKYTSLYNPDIYSLLQYFHIFDLYHSWWFTILLICLSVNILICTCIQIRRISRLYMFKQEKIDYSIPVSSGNNKQFFSNKGVFELEEKLRVFLKSLMGCDAYCIKKNDGIYLFAERGRWSRFGMVFVHFSILFILCGGLIAAIWGFIGHMNLVEGQQSNRVILNGEKDSLLLDFDVRCDDFTVDFYDNGLPKEYQSNLSIVERGKPILSVPVRVNHPLKYRGLKFCQASYGISRESYAMIDVRNNRTGEETTLKMGIMEKTPLPGSESFLAIGTFNADYQGHGPSVPGVLIEKGTPHRIFRISHEGVVEGSETGDFSFRLMDFKKQYYTGLRITYNPGSPLIWIGFILVFCGFIINFFSVHKRIWVMISPLNEGSEIKIAVSASKQKEAFEEKLAILLGRMDRGNEP